MYSIRYRRRAQRELHGLPDEARRRIGIAIDRLGDEPRPTGCRKLKAGEDAYRIRVGRYRVVYEVDDGGRVVSVYRVVLRTEKAYRGL